MLSAANYAAKSSAIPLALNLRWQRSRALNKYWQDGFELSEERHLASQLGDMSFDRLAKLKDNPSEDRSFNARIAIRARPAELRVWCGQG